MTAPVDPDAGSAYEQLCGEMLIDPVKLSAEIRAEILAPLPGPAADGAPTATIEAEVVGTATLAAAEPEPAS